MCLAIPAKVINIDGMTASVDMDGVKCEACIMLVEDVKVGDYLLLHAGFAIQKLDEKEALETLELWRQL